MNTKSLIFLSSTVLFFIVFVFGHIYWSGPSYGFDAITYSFYSLLLAIGTVFLLPKVHENLTHHDFNVRLKLLYKFTFIISLTLVLYLYYLTWLDLSSDTYTHQSGLWHLTTYKDFGGGGYSKHYYYQPFVGLIGLWTAILTYLFFTFQLKIRQTKRISLILIPLILYIFLIIIHQYIDKPRWLG